MHAGIPPPPWEQTPSGADPPGSRPPWSRHPLGADTPQSSHSRSRNPQEQTPPGADTPPSRHPPGSRIQHTVYEQLVRILLECILVTSRNEVVAKVMFLHVSVILFTGGVSWQGDPPGQGEPPPGQGEPPQTGRNPSPQTRQTPPNQADPPQTRETPQIWQTSPTRQTCPPRTRQTPPRDADSRIRSTSGRYASYWNAFLLASDSVSTLSIFLAVVQC